MCGWGSRFPQVRKEKWVWRKPTSYHCLMSDLTLTLQHILRSVAEPDSTTQGSIWRSIRRFEADNTLVFQFLQTQPPPHLLETQLLQHHPIYLCQIDENLQALSLFLWWRPESWPHSQPAYRSSSHLHLFLFSSPPSMWMHSSGSSEMTCAGAVTSECPPQLRHLREGWAEPARGEALSEVGVHSHTALRQGDLCPGHKNFRHAESGPYGPRDGENEVIVFSLLWSSLCLSNCHTFLRDPPGFH